MSEIDILELDYFFPLSFVIFIKKKIYREKEKWRALPSAGSLSTWLQWSELNGHGAQSQDILLGLPHGNRAQDSIHPPLFSQAIIQEMDQKWNSRDEKRHLYGMLMLQGGGLAG